MRIYPPRERANRGRGVRFRRTVRRARPDVLAHIPAHHAALRALSRSWMALGYADARAMFDVLIENGVISVEIEGQLLDWERRGFVVAPAP